MTAPALRPEPRTSAAGADGGQVGRWAGCRELVSSDRERAHLDQPHTLTTGHIAPRVRVFGRFAVPSPSFPTTSGGERGRRGRHSTKRGTQRPHQGRSGGRTRTTDEAGGPQLGQGRPQHRHRGAHVRPRGGVGVGR
jgi:hypothetical protein